MKTWWPSLYDFERREKEAMPLHSGAFSMARKDNPITGDTRHFGQQRAANPNPTRGDEISPFTMVFGGFDLKMSFSEIV
jgi:hypothetical protein